MGPTGMVAAWHISKPLLHGERSQSAHSIRRVLNISTYLVHKSACLGIKQSSLAMARVT